MMVHAQYQSLAEALSERTDKRLFLALPDGRRWSYASLLGEVQERQRLLEQWNVKPGHRVALKLEDSAEFILWFLALLSADHIVVPVDPQAPSSDLERTLSRTGSVWLLDEGQMPRLLADPEGRSSLNQGGLILLTSGSTGDPKPVGLPWHSLWHTAGQVVRAHQLRPQDIGFSPLPLFHINGLVVGVLSAIRAGSTLIAPGRFHASDFWEVTDAFDATWINAVPALIGVLAGRPERPRHPSRIRFMRSASAPLSAALRRTAESLFQIPIVETYGMTEASSQITANPLPQQGLRSGTVGIPWGIELRIVNKKSEPLEAGKRGYVEIRGPGVIDPDWGPNRWAAASMTDGWYRTGDVGRVDSEGYLYLIGRSRDVINRGGEKVFPREVEEWLLACPDVGEAVVLGEPHAVLGEEPVAYVAPVPGKHLSEEGLKAWAEHGLAKFKRPTAFVIMPHLPRGSTGKVLKNALRRRQSPS
ncbi:class I adenylate-forming enzyme family protein [Sulfobacillus harzensis]|uniref:AMP-binding protein n=1 Tax=Sulfobacillus harzensis TaxID=2729629 RepID=A0A7Y0L7D4_9FIRM|nr:AMP-binding protein [Sulfobacillus harzensis]NMP24086.1 AMP-binding protein [Sulfobacillus harzensis]